MWARRHSQPRVESPTLVNNRSLVQPYGPAPSPGAPPAARDADARNRRWANRWNNLRSVFAAFQLAKRPDEVKYVFMMGNAQDDIAEGERSSAQIRDPFRSPELEAMWQARFCPRSFDLEPLMALPADTLGGAYARHMRALGLRPDFYEDVAAR